MMPAGVEAEDRIDLAISAFEQRDLIQAERLCRDILAGEPDHVEALNLLGVVLQNDGLAGDSIPLLIRATEIDPAFPDAFANLARAFRFTGQTEQAVAAAQQATQLDGSLAEGWLQLGFALATSGRNEEAIPALLEAVARNPDNADLHAALGTSAIALQDLNAAAAAWRDVIRLQPDRFDALLSLGNVLTDMDKADEAMPLLRRALVQAPGDIDALEAWARNAHRRFDGAELITACREILARQPDRLDILALESNGYVWLGQFDEIERIREAVLRINPEDRSFAQQIGAMIPGFMDQREIAFCRTELENPALPIGQRIDAGYALAKTLDRGSDHDAAFSAYMATNALRRETDATAGRRFNIGQLQSYIANMRSTYTPTMFKAFHELGNPSELPVFIAGMPRSGTSLVEQIAASHPRVFGAGERKDIMDIVTRLNRDRGFIWPTQWDLDAFRREADDHIARLQDVGGTVDRVIDKLPDNIQLLGQIRLLFPNARIIICRRDLRDVCVSCFTTRFGDHITWATDLEDCAERAVEIERLTRHWRLVLPGPVMEIQYETLVGNLEAESRRLIDFLGLDWDPACLEFHKTNRPVSTSSAWQVRQPLYDSSIGRWRRYRAHLGPMLTVLEGFVPPDSPSS